MFFSCSGVFPVHSPGKMEPFQRVRRLATYQVMEHSRAFRNAGTHIPSECPSVPHKPARRSEMTFRLQPRPDKAFSVPKPSKREPRLARHPSRCNAYDRSLETGTHNSMILLLSRMRKGDSSVLKI